MNMRWLTRLSGVEDQPEWSPDGTRILFRHTVGERSDLFVINVDGTGLTNLTDGLPPTMTARRDPTWSRDGTRIAQGGMPTRLALAGDQRSPAWSRDGHYIAVNGTAVAGQGQTDIYTLRPDGTCLRLRTINPAWGGGFNPAWIAR